MGTPHRILSQDELNRALIERQMLRERADLGAFATIERLFGIQAQEPKSPYIGLWTRLENFRAEELEDLLVSRHAVRILLMRGTIHLVSAQDALALRPLTQIKLDRELQSGPFASRLRGLDLDAVAEAGRKILEDTPQGTADAGKRLLERWPDREHTVLGNALRNKLALVQLPPRGLWHRSGRAVCTTLEAWLDQEQHPMSLETLVLRYLKAFGPATVMDAQQWSGLTRLAETFEALRPQLVTFGNEAGKELFDLPDAPRPDPGTPVPVRLLPEFDNILLAHADRRRVIADDRLGVVVGGKPTVLVDGYVVATWSITKDSTITVDYLDSLPPSRQKAVAEECDRLQDWIRT
ncbi:winged helix DNA-binding domain-containing protein [Lentzea sp. BCCO 10_0856]|uniref:Winged helix DNA-binding domain-containing protein n=1 Tax=Lentzea miocenica TaxID=3095431 RepID=A0ABU4TH14_9PSEU|nr:winged helix DNA-binding domain-containing protein [Lentzea sp. BCCO 10_0856]MDX8037488.1 winged helix DNA-binding domain-containing protein [Lentzea sp. BCCO 10_0856]